MYLSTILAEGEAQPGGFNPMMLVLLALFAVMIFMMFRNRKKMAAAQAERTSQLVPGAEIMTTAGIFGTVLSVDSENNRAVVEVAPGNNITFDLRAVSQVVSSPAAPVADSPADAAAAASSSVESDEYQKLREASDDELKRLRDGNDEPGTDTPRA